MKQELPSPKQILRFLGQVTLLVIVVAGLTVAVCWLIGWNTVAGYTVGLLIAGGTTTMLGVVLTSEPLMGRGMSGRRGMKEVDKARIEERRQDRVHDRSLLDRFVVTGAIVMALGVAVYGFAG